MTRGHIITVKTVLDENAKKTVIAVTGYDFYEDTKLGKEILYDVLEYLKDKAVADAISKGISEGIAQGIFSRNGTRIGTRKEARNG